MTVKQSTGIVHDTGMHNKIQTYVKLGQTIGHYIL